MPPWMNTANSDTGSQISSIIDLQNQDSNQPDVFMRKRDSTDNDREIHAKYCFLCRYRAIANMTDISGDDTVDRRVKEYVDVLESKLHGFSEQHTVDYKVTDLVDAIYNTHRKVILENLTDEKDWPVESIRYHILHVSANTRREAEISHDLKDVGFIMKHLMKRIIVEDTVEDDTGAITKQEVFNYQAAGTYHKFLSFKHTLLSQLSGGSSGRSRGGVPPSKKKKSA